MAELRALMTYDDAVNHLRQEVCGTARFETGRLIDPQAPAFFGAVRGVMCDLDYVAALYAGWDGANRRHIATGAKSVRFLREVVAIASGEAGYDAFAEHLYQLYRVGTVHLRAPKVLVAAHEGCSTPALSWALMQARRGSARIGRSVHSLRHLAPVEVAKTIGDFPTATLLPVSIHALFDDFLSACEFFAVQLEAEERSGGHELLERWRSTADALASPEPTDALRW